MHETWRLLTALNPGSSSCALEIRIDNSQLPLSPEGTLAPLRVGRQALKAALMCCQSRLLSGRLHCMGDDTQIGISKHWQLSLRFLLHATFRAKPGALLDGENREGVVISCGR